MSQNIMKMIAGPNNPAIREKLYFFNIVKMDLIQTEITS